MASETQLHEIKKTVLPNGTIVLDNLPFEAGEKVKVTIIRSEESDELDRELIAATARIYDVPLITADSDIVQYPHVKQIN